MNILSAELLSKAFTERKLFHDISFGINDQDRIGLIGLNGTGKSTLLKCLGGLETLDEGNVVTRKNMLIKYLPQNPVFDEASTVLENLFKSDNKKLDILKNYEETLKAISLKPEDSLLQKKYDQLLSHMDTMEVWQVESEMKGILNKLGIPNIHAPMHTLSGGQKRRVAMAEALIVPSDLLILDEPTNHIDNETIEWLENYLKNRQGALLMVTHDRYFLDRVTDKIFELSQGDLKIFDGNYSGYLKAKAQEEIALLSKQRKITAQYEEEYAWIKRGCQARSTKQKYRVNRFQTLKDQVKNKKQDEMNINMGQQRLGRKIVLLNHVSKSYDHKIIDDFDYTLLRDDRIGVIGRNGIGKSTLLKLIAGDIKPDAGEVDLGQTVKIGYYKQEDVIFNEAIRVIDYIKETAEFVENNQGETLSASQMLETFLFDSDMQYNYISKLSGGEKRRLYLLKILMDAPNILLLDEPTNDLDIETLSILEDYLDVFNGAVIAVSHDRYFLNKISEKIFAFEEGGIINIHPGNYNTYLEHKNRFGNIETKEETSTKDKTETSPKASKKLTYGQQLEFEGMEAAIEEAEAHIANIEEKMASETSNYELLQKIIEEKEAADLILENLYQRWAYLNDLQDS